MTGVLRGLRSELVTALGTDLTTYDHVPARAVMPCAFITPGSPYIEQGQTFDERIVRFGVLLLTSPSLNDVETHDLDERIEQLHARIDADGWTIERVEQPSIQDLNGAEVLATEIVVATGATF